ncbi:YihY/virulence factor BrkB family protein [Herbinix luporum]|uniref:Putative membrane protein n=1 Tax=Herbinix luporum TaxID=1679721 RepID=A0A0K8J7X4_9FIRM|nr:YihY/virulence factor BrkB family protein [Herbinix luporum]CUH93539.1 putative membrane protein [Herbinix luporum]
MIKSILKLTTLFSRKIRDDYVSAFSAQAAFFIIISFFPFIMFLLSIVPFFNIQESTILTIFTQIFPKAFNSFVVRVITDVYERTNSGTLISITAITALWSAGKGFFAIMKGLNSVYNIQETRHTLFLRITSTIYTLVFAIMLVASIVLFVFGNKLYFWTTRRFPVLQDLALVIISLRTIVGLITLFVFFLVIYIVVPNRKTKVSKEVPGAMICAGGWMGFSYAFSYYIDHYSNYASMYGSLTTIVLFMLWLYFCMYLLFIGAEINQFLQDKSWDELKQLYRNPPHEITIDK